MNDVLIAVRSTVSKLICLFENKIQKIFYHVSAMLMKWKKFLPKHVQKIFVLQH